MINSRGGDEAAVSASTDQSLHFSTVRLGILNDVMCNKADPRRVLPFRSVCQKENCHAKW